MASSLQTDSSHSSLGAQVPSASRITLPPRIAALFPFQSRFAKISGGNLHYIDEGRGDKVVLLLHGNPTWVFYYRKLIAALKENFRVIAVDHLGCGLSDRTPTQHWRAADRVGHLEEFLDQLGIKKFSLVMHDWGGPIGTSLACRRSESIERMVYLNTTLTEIESLPGIIKRANAPFIGPILTKHTKHFLKLMLRFGVARKVSDDVAAGYLFPYQTAASRTAIWDFVEDIPFESSHPSYPEMMAFGQGLPALAAKTPVQIIWGLRDPCFHREMLRRVASHFPNAQVLERPNASHLVLEDEPEIVVPAIDAFLRGEEEQPRAHDASATNTLYDSFQRFAAQYASAGAVVVPEAGRDVTRYARVSFAGLRSLVAQYERGLQHLGLAPRDRVLMLVPAGIDFVALSLAVMGRGAVPVYVDPGIGRQKLMRCIADAAPDAMIAAPKAHILRLLKRRLFSLMKFAVVVSDLPFMPGVTTGALKHFSDTPLPPASGDGTCLVAFTSGATGTPKGVMFSNEMVEAELKIFVEQFGFRAGTLDLPLLTIFALFNVAVGVGSVFPPMNPSRPLDLDPRVICRIIDECAVVSSFGSPTLWSKISDFCKRNARVLTTLERVFMAGAPVSPQVLAQVQSVLPNGLAYTPYGATEALPVTIIAAKDILDRKPRVAKTGEVGTYVGKPISGVELRILPVTLEPIASLEGNPTLAPYEIGEVIVRGANVSRAYLSRPDANKQGKIPDPTGRWHRMGDCGFVDEEGGLYFCGRVAHSLEFAGRRYFSIPVERYFNEHPAVRRSALIGLFEGQELGIAVEPHRYPEDEAARAALIEELRAIAKKHNLPIQKFFFHRSFPVDSRHNAKIFRDQLGIWATEQLRSSR